jgi:hypothetical protein
VRILTENESKNEKVKPKRLYIDTKRDEKETIINVDEIQSYTSKDDKYFVQDWYNEGELVLRLKLPTEILIFHYKTKRG